MNNIKKIHLIGIGGAGMSGIAEILINLLGPRFFMITVLQMFQVKI